MFLIDSSRGVTEDVYKKEKEFVNTLVGHFNINTRGPRATAVIYGNTASTISSFVEPGLKGRVISAPLLNTPRRMDKALEHAADILKSSVGNRKVVILLTAGRQSAGKPVGDAVQQLRNVGAQIYVVAIGRDPNSGELARIVQRLKVRC